MASRLRASASSSSGAPVAAWRPIRTLPELEAGIAALPGGAWRLKAALGGYDGRSQIRIPASPSRDLLAGSFAALERSAEAHGLLLEREIDFAAEISVVVARDLAGRVVPFPVARNVHEEGILVESVAPAPVDAAVSSISVRTSRSTSARMK